MKNPFQIISAFLAGLFFLTVSSLSIYAQQLTAVQNYGVNRPGVVMVRTVFSADVYVNKMQLD